MTPNVVTPSHLVGAWTLLGWQIFSEAATPATEPFGPTPQGLLQYTADGWMSAAVCRAQRAALPAGISPRKMEAGLLADAWRSYFHYAGRWEIVGDSVIHHVRLSLNPAMVGSDQVRHMTFGGTLAEPTLTLTGIEHINEHINGLQRRHVLRWQRATDDAIGAC